MVDEFKIPADRLQQCVKKYAEAHTQVTTKYITLQSIEKSCTLLGFAYGAVINLHGFETIKHALAAIGALDPTMTSGLRFKLPPAPFKVVIPPDQATPEAMRYNRLVERLHSLRPTISAQFAD